MPLPQDVSDTIDEILNKISIATIAQRIPDYDESYHMAKAILEQSNHVPSKPEAQGLSRGELMLSEDAAQHPVHLLVVKHLSFWLCGRNALDQNGHPLYVELAFRKDPTEELAAKQFFGQLFKNATEAVSQRGLQLQPVYIPAQIAHPRGYFISELVSDPLKMKSLLVACFGDQNQLKCLPCASLYLKNITDHGENVFWPYHECRSIPGFMDGRCANCIWHGDETCPGRMLTAYQLKVAKQKAEGTWTEPKHDSFPTVKLNPALYPRVSCDYPSRLGADENKAAYETAQDETPATEE